MRWKVITPNKEYVVSATSSGEAVKKIVNKGKGPVTSAKLMPKNIVDEIKNKWRKWFE